MSDTIIFDTEAAVQNKPLMQEVKTGKCAKAG